MPPRAAARLPAPADRNLNTTHSQGQLTPCSLRRLQVCAQLQRISGGNGDALPQECAERLGSLTEDELAEIAGELARRPRRASLAWGERQVTRLRNL